MREKGKVVDYLDIKNKVIIESTPIKILDTIENYYSEECEIFLSEHIESPFAEISKNIKSFSNGKLKKLTLNPDDIHSIFDFYNYTFSRSKFAKKQADLNLITAVIQPVTNEELIWLQRHNIFNEYCVRILINRAKTNFVIPRNCFYIKTSTYSDKPYIILPFSKKTSIILLSKEEDIANRQYDNEFLYIDSNQEIEKLNKNALYFEILMNNEFIVGDKSELYRLKELLLESV
jgi:hypothetical protein